MRVRRMERTRTFGEGGSFRFLGRQLIAETGSSVPWGCISRLVLGRVLVARIRLPVLPYSESVGRRTVHSRIRFRESGRAFRAERSEVDLATGYCVGMSQENVALFRKAIDCYNRRDLESMLQMWHPEAEWYPFTAQVEGDDAYHGHEGLRGWWANVDATFEEIEASVEEVRDLGDTVLARPASRPVQERRRVGLGDRLAHPLPRRSWRLGSGIPKPCRNPRGRWAAGVVQAPHRVHKGNFRDTRHGWAQQPKERCPPRPPFHRQTAEGLARDDARAFVDGDKR